MRRDFYLLTDYCQLEQAKFMSYCVSPPFNFFIVLVAS